MHFGLIYCLFDEVEKNTIYSVLAGCLQHDWTLSETDPTPKSPRAGPRCSGRGDIYLPYCAREHKDAHRHMGQIWIKLPYGLDFTFLLAWYNHFYRV